MTIRSCCDDARRGVDDERLMDELLQLCSWFGGENFRDDDSSSSSSDDEHDDEDDDDDEYPQNWLESVQGRTTVTLAKSENVYREPSVSDLRLRSVLRFESERTLEAAFRGELEDDSSRSRFTEESQTSTGESIEDSQDSLWDNVDFG